MDEDAKLPADARLLEIWVHVPPSWESFDGVICPFTEGLAYGVCFSTDNVGEWNDVSDVYTAGSDIVLEASPKGSLGGDHTEIGRITSEHFGPTRRVLVELDPDRAPSSYDDLLQEPDPQTIATVRSIRPRESIAIGEAQPVASPCAEDEDC